MTVNIPIPDTVSYDKVIFRAPYFPYVGNVVTCRGKIGIRTQGTASLMDTELTRLVGRTKKLSFAGDDLHTGPLRYYISIEQGRNEVQTLVSAHLDFQSELITCWLS